MLSDPLRFSGFQASGSRASKLQVHEQSKRKQTRVIRGISSLIFVGPLPNNRFKEGSLALNSLGPCFALKRVTLINRVRHKWAVKDLFWAWQGSIPSLWAAVSQPWATSGVCSVARLSR